MKTTGIKETESNQGPSGKNILTRDQVLQLSSETIRQLHQRVNGVRFKEQSSDSARLAHVRALTALMQLYAGLLKDAELIDLERRISDLEVKR
jgi:hypothetical protein